MSGETKKPLKLHELVSANFAGVIVQIRGQSEPKEYYVLRWPVSEDKIIATAYSSIGEWGGDYIFGAGILSPSCKDLEVVTNLRGIPAIVRGMSEQIKDQVRESYTKRLQALISTGDKSDLRNQDSAQDTRVET